jgi:hypothetical protein
MPCAFCGEGNTWIKTCRAPAGLIRVCDPCWEVLSPWLVIVPGDGVVTGRCDECERYFNPREMAEFSPGGRYNAYAGKCEACAEVGAGLQAEVPSSVP